LQQQNLLQGNFKMRPAKIRNIAFPSPRISGVKNAVKAHSSGMEAALSLPNAQLNNLKF
jgi:hypothetical protein